MEKRLESVPYIVFEGEIARQERYIRRMWLSLLALLLALVFVVGSFLLYLNQYDFESYQQDGEGVNIIGDMNGVDYNGTKSPNTNQKESLVGER